MSNTNWQNLPSTSTPVNATNLNKIEKKIKQYYIPTNIEDIKGWYLALSGSITGYNNHRFKLSLDLLNGFSGILDANIRCNNSNSLELIEFKWLSNTGLNSSDFKLKLDGNNYYLYVRVPLEWGRYAIKVIQSGTLNDDNEDILTFYTPTADDTVSEPDGVTPTGYSIQTVTLARTSDENGFIATDLPVHTKIVSVIGSVDGFYFPYDDIGNNRMSVKVAQWDFSPYVTTPIYLEIVYLS